MPPQAAGSRPESRPGLLASILVLILLFPLGYSVVRGVIAQGNEPPERPDPQHQRCVGDRQGGEMRFHHWEYLRRIREEVVRYGNRREDGLNACPGCHTSRRDFCDRCHQAVNLSPDCFDCHDYPYEHSPSNVPTARDPLAAE